jgi:hypothetical protein
MKNGIILFLAFGLLIVIANASYGENVNSTSYEEIEAAVADLRKENDALRGRLGDLESTMEVSFLNNQACHGCGNSLNDCSCENSGGWLAGVSLYNLKPHWKNNPAYISFNGDNYERVEINWDHKTAWDVWLGRVNDSGFGWRTRYWEFDHGLEFSPVVSGNAYIPVPMMPRDGYLATGNLSQMTTSLELGVWDFEATQSFFVRGWQCEVAGGLRYAHTRQTYNVSETGDYGTVLYYQTINSRHNFDGCGPVVSLEGRRSLSPDWLSFFAKSRGSLLGGKASGYSDLRQEYINPTWTNTKSYSADENKWDALAIVDLEIGVRASRSQTSVTTFVELAAVGYMWFGAGNASNADFGIGSSTQYLTSNDNENLGLFGGRLTFGVIY